MALFLGLMKVAERGGLLVIIARLVRPMMVRLFPEVPPEHPAMGAMILNMSANALGLGNAATPFGIRAMQQLDKLNPVKGTASNAMILFLAINTSSATLLATGVIALRAASGSGNPADIVPTTTAIIVAKPCIRWFPPATAGPPQTEKAALGRRHRSTQRRATKATTASNWSALPPAPTQFTSPIWYSAASPASFR